MQPAQDTGVTSLEEGCRTRRRGRARAHRRRAGRHRHRDLRPGDGRRGDPDLDPVGRPWPARRPARARQDEARRDARHRARARSAPGAVHAGSDAGRHPRLRSARGGGERPPCLPFRQGPDLRATPHGGRDQSRKPAHPICAAPGHAGAARDGRGRTPRPAAPLPRARDPESDRTGRHLPAPRGPARSLPAANRRALSRPRRREAGADRDDGANATCSRNPP